MPDKAKIIAGMEIQEDVLKLRIENEQLKEQNNNLQIMLKAEREVRCNEDYLKKVCELEEQIEKMKCCANCESSEEDNKTQSICDKCFEMCNWKLKE